MIEQQRTSSSWRIITYRIAKWVLTITAWIWTTIIITFLAQYVPNLLTTKSAEIGGTWTGEIINWLGLSNTISTHPVLSHPVLSHPLDILKPIVLIIAVLLIVIPPLAFVLKQTLQGVQREGFDKLIDVLQQDTISPKLEELEDHLKQQMQMQNACFKALEQIRDVLQKTPTSSYLEELHTSSQQQQQSLQKEFSHILQDLQNRASKQAGRLGDLYQQEQGTQETISLGLQKIASLLEQIRDGSKTDSLQGYQERTSFSNHQSVTDEVPAVASSAQTNHQEHAIYE